MRAAFARIERALDFIEQSSPQEGMSPVRRQQAAEALRSLDSLISELKTARDTVDAGKDGVHG